MDKLKTVGLIGIGVIIAFVGIIVFEMVWYATLDYETMDCYDLGIELAFEKDMLPMYQLSKDLEGIERWNEVRSLHDSKCK